MSLRLTSKPRFLALAASFLVFAASAHAVTIAPARMELTGDPGKTITGEFVVTNEETAARTFYTSAQNFEARGESGTPNFTSSDTDLASWVKIPPQVTLTPGEKVTVPYTIDIPAGADAGGHFAAIFLSTAPPAGGQVTIGAKIGVLLLLRVSGDVSEAGGVNSFSPDGKRFYTSLPVSFSYRFTNSGGDRVNPHGTIAVRDLIFLKAAEFSANPGEGNVLPGSTRKFTATWGDGKGVPSGFFSAIGYEWNHFAIGPYRANLTLAYGVNGNAHATAWVFVLPWQLMIVFALILLVIIPLIWHLIRRYNRWIIAQARAER